jgi:hypothetical protein
MRQDFEKGRSENGPAFKIIRASRNTSGKQASLHRVLCFDGKQDKSQAGGCKAQERKSFDEKNAARKRSAANDVKGSIGILDGCLFFFSF